MQLRGKSSILRLCEDSVTMVSLFLGESGIRGVTGIDGAAVL